MGFISSFDETVEAILDIVAVFHTTKHYCDGGAEGKGNSKFDF